MKFKGQGLRGAVLRTMGAALAATLLASCGGGEQVEPFAPVRVLAFGDENSVIESNGHKYTVNEAAFACAANPIWVQHLAADFGMVFQECPGTVVAPRSRIFASATNNRATNVQAQIDAFLASSPGEAFGGKDLVTMLAGQQDLLDQYAAYKGGATEAQATAVVTQAAAVLAVQANRVANAGGKVLVSLVPNLALSPQASTATDATNTDATRAVLTRLTTTFNNTVRTQLINDGRKIGLIVFDDIVQTARDNPAASNFDNVTSMACTTLPVQDCTTAGADTNYNRFLWADGTHVTPAGHSLLGSAAVARARNNPF